MKENEKKALLKLMGVLGFVVLLIGAMTPLYDAKYGALGMLVLWGLAAVMATYLGVEKKKKKKKR